jgi:hypothetical protein
MQALCIAHQSLTFAALVLCCLVLFLELCEALGQAAVHICRVSRQTQQSMQGSAEQIATQVKDRL